MSGLRIIFMGTAELACPSLHTLNHHDDFDVVAVVTQPDRPSGRHLNPHASPVKELASREHLPVSQPERARDESFVQELRQLQPDLIVVVAYGQILPASILELPRWGCMNVHTSLLPKYRGAAPIQWAILNDEKETGVTVMRMDAGLDTGDILTQSKTPIEPDYNSQTLHDRLSKMGAELLAQTIPDFVAGKIQPRPQPAEGVSHAPKIKKQDGHLDWTQPARNLWNRVRAFTPWPGAFTFLPAQPRPHLLKIWRAEVAEQSGDQPGEILQANKSGILVACGRDALLLHELQLEGSRRMSARQFLLGHALKPGWKLG